MNYFNYLLILLLPLLKSGPEIKTLPEAASRAKVKPEDAVYKVSRLKKPLKIDANWNKPQWKKIESIKIDKYMGKIPAFKPEVEAKMMYDNNNVYVIFRVKDRFVRSVVQE